MRFLVLVILIAATAPAHADGGGFYGVGFGPKYTFDGSLGERFAGAETSGRFRFGFRAHRFGAELVMGGGGVDAMGFTTASVFSATPRLTGYLVTRRPLQVAVHGGVGFGAISATRTEQVPCRLEEECGFKSEERSLSFLGISLEGGVVAQLSLKRGHSRPMLWVDYTVAARRHRVEDVNVGGYSRVLTIGIAHAID
jgi:hypothetical protein